MFPGPWQWAIVALVFLLLFGGKRIPQMMRSIGSSITEFKKGINETDETDETDEAEDAGSNKNSSGDAT